MQISKINVQSTMGKNTRQNVQSQKQNVSFGIADLPTRSLLLELCSNKTVSAKLAESNINVVDLLKKIVEYPKLVVNRDLGDAKLTYTDNVRGVRIRDLSKKNNDYFISIDESDLQTSSNYVAKVLVRLKKYFDSHAAKEDALVKVAELNMSLAKIAENLNNISDNALAKIEALKEKDKISKLIDKNEDYANVLEQADVLLQEKAKLKELIAEHDTLHNAGRIFYITP